MKPIDYNGKYTITIKELIKQGHDIFPSSFPYYNPEKVEEFKQKFIKHFYYYEIGQDTLEEFKDQLEDTLVLNFPKYQHYYETWKVAKDLRWWYNKDYTVEHNRILDQKNQAENHNENRSNNLNHYIAKVQNEGNSTSKFLDTPQGLVQNLDDGYMTNITKDNNQDTTNSSGNSEGNTTSASDTNNNRHGVDIEIIRNLEYGNIGTTSSGHLVKKWLDNGLFNIDLLMIEDCQELFMLVF